MKEPFQSDVTVCPFANVQRTVHPVMAVVPLLRTSTEALKPPGHWFVMVYVAEHDFVPPPDGDGDADAERDGEGDAEAERDGDGEADVERDADADGEPGGDTDGEAFETRSPTWMPRPLVPT